MMCVEVLAADVNMYEGGVEVVCQQCVLSMVRKKWPRMEVCHR